MIIHTIISGPFETNSYVAVCEKTNACALIDAAPASFPKIEQFIKLKHLSPKALLLTHSHWDHIEDASLIVEKYMTPVFIHAMDKENLESPGSDGLPCWISIKGIKATDLIEEGDEISVGSLIFKTIYTPGHTPGGVCFYCAYEDVLFSGDTLFKGTIGNLSFLTARPSLMWGSLGRLGNLPLQTRVFPGHGEETMIGHEKWLSRAEEIFGQ